MCPFNGENDALDAEEVLVGVSGLATRIANQLNIGKVDTPVEYAMRRGLRLKVRVKPKYKA
jgi:hypothetical protein